MRKVILVVVLAILAAPATSSAAERTAVVRVGAVPTTWTSPQAFPAKSQIAVTITWGRYDLDMTGEGSCTAYFGGHGITARVDFCGRKGRIPLQVRLASVREKPTKVKIAYEVF